MKIVELVLRAIERSPFGLVNLDVLESLRLSDRNTLKTTLSRLQKTGRIVRLKRGVYATRPLQDPYVCAQTIFNGYLGFTTALYLHKLITEIPFTLFVVTPRTSGRKQLGAYEFQAVSLAQRAIGFEQKGPYTLSTRAKTLFDCVYLPRYSIEPEKLMEAYRQAKLTNAEVKEFRYYVRKLAHGSAQKRMEQALKTIGGW